MDNYERFRIEHQYARKPIHQNEPNTSARSFGGLFLNNVSTETSIQPSTNDSIRQIVPYDSSESDVSNEQIIEILPESRKMEIDFPSQSNDTESPNDDWEPSDWESSEISNDLIDENMEIGLPSQLTESSSFQNQPNSSPNDESDDLPSQSPDTESPIDNVSIDHEMCFGWELSDIPNDMIDDSMENGLPSQLADSPSVESQPNSSQNDETDDEDDVFEVERILAKRTYRSKVIIFEIN